MSILEIYDETSFECQILTEEPAINAPAVEDKADEENSSPFLDEQCCLHDEPVPEKYDEKTIECQILPAEPAVNASGARNKADGEKTSTFLDEKCSLQDAPVL
ncbi:hypothetical protein AVEN_139473-1 [Araneus ventricosus]|uniref:Uncharacterized protein n=1 Tax=Araneus ventricosus TaxID=182803 RepID=A0A4Y2GQ36_ARAVE|nr:hypothetical protein AVEN_122393-1 [Araneus ventricosus]GBM54658.1 hypothetical protein AVEN_139473-1 [Araneus ventricosus]